MSPVVSACALVAGSTNDFADDSGCVKELLNTPQMCAFYATPPLVIGALLRLWSLSGCTMTGLLKGRRVWLLPKLPSLPYACLGKGGSGRAWMGGGLGLWKETCVLPEPPPRKTVPERVALPLPTLGLGCGSLALGSVCTSCLPSGPAPVPQTLPVGVSLASRSCLEDGVRSEQPVNPSQRG